MLYAQSGPYTVKVEQDLEPLNPRVDYEPFGKMVCWHRRYHLGDPHEFHSPGEFLQDLVSKNSTSTQKKDVVQAAKEGKFDGIRLEYDQSEKTWNLEAFDSYSKQWYIEEPFPPPLNEAAAFVGIVETLETSQLQKLAENVVEMLPLHLLDHSGITMRTQSFNDPWDSGQVGWIYATHEAIQKEYGALTPETIQRARGALQGEVTDYDCYLQGECYAFTIYKNGRECDSCGGFLGELDNVLDDMKDYMPKGHEDMLDRLSEEKPSIRRTLKMAQRKIAAPSKDCAAKQAEMGR